ncbi:MAG: FtsH protease activity modulator HflK [bacterium]
MTKEEITALISSFVNLVLTVIKFCLAIYTGSIALLAEAWHSLSDIFSSFMVFAAIRADRIGSISEERATQSQEIYRDTGSIFKDEDSHQKEKPSLAGKRFFTGLEEKVAVGIGLFLIFASYKIFMKVIHPETIAIRNPVPVALVILILALFSYLLFKFEVYVGEKSKSPGLIADGYHSKIDMFASMLVSVALVSEHIGFRIDKIAAVVICVAILIHALHVLTRALKAYIHPQGKAYLKGAQPHEDILVVFIKEKLPLLMDRLYTALSKKLHLEGSYNQNKIILNKIITIVVLIIVAGIYFSSGIYMLKPYEKAIVERFGKPLNITKPVLPGLHYALPLPIDRINRVDTERIRRISIGYKASKDYQLILWTNIHYKEEMPFLTGENSFLGLTMNVHYRIQNLSDFLYKNSSPEGLMEELANTILTNTLSKRVFFPTITVNREGLEEEILEILQTKLDEFKTGIWIEGIHFRDMHPPTDIAPAFEDVVSAQEDYETYIHKAKGYENKVIPNARATKIKMKNEAIAYRNNVLAKSKGETGRFLDQQAAYRKHPDITETRLYIEGMEEILPDVQKFIICPKEGEKIPDIWFFQGNQAGISTIIREEK